MFLLQRKKRPVIVTIHGFGQRLHTEFDPLKDYFHKKYKVVQFDIYDVNNPSDANEKEWIARCERQMREITQQGGHSHWFFNGWSHRQLSGNDFPCRKAHSRCPCF